MSFACAEHPQHLGVGVCASCVREKLVDCIGSLKIEEPLPASTRDGSSYGSPNASNMYKSAPSSYYPQGNEGVSSKCKYIAQGRHIRAISGDENHKESAFYVANLHGKSSNYVLCEKEERPFSSLLAKVLVKRGATQRANYSAYTVSQYGSSPASLIWDTPRPSTSKSPLKLGTPSPAPSNLPSSTQPSRSPLLLSTASHEPTISSPLQLPPLMSSLPAAPPSPLRLRSARPTIASHTSSRTHFALSAEEANRRSGQRVISGKVRTKRKGIWLSVMLRKLRTFTFKRRFERQKEEVESVQADSNRPSSATDSDFYRHSHSGGYNWNQARHSQYAYNSYSDFQISAFNYRQQRERREDSCKTMPRGTNFSSCRDNGHGWDSYYNNGPVQSSGLQARHRYKSISCVQRRENAELLRFYLTPPSF